MAIARRSHTADTIGDISVYIVLFALVSIHIAQTTLLPLFGLPTGYDSWIIAASATTADPLDPFSYLTAAVSHSSWSHLARNVVLLIVPLWFLRRELGLGRTLGVFTSAAVIAVIVFVFVGYLSGYNGFVRGASGGSFALLALAGLVAHRIDWSRGDRSIALPLWLVPFLLLCIETMRLLVDFPMSATPYAHIGHMAGVIVGIGAWWLLGRPTSR